MERSLLTHIMDDRHQKDRIDEGKNRMSQYTRSEQGKCQEAQEQPGTLPMRYAKLSVSCIVS